MAINPKALPKDVQDAIEKHIRLVDDSRADTMRRILGNRGTITAWEALCSNKKAKKSLTREELITTLYDACYEAAFILQRPEMMTKGEARKIVEGLELLARYEKDFFLSIVPSMQSSPSYLLEKYRVYAQELPTGARRRPEARSIALRLCCIFTKRTGTKCHSVTAAIIRAALGGDCDAATVRAYVASET